MVSDEAVPAGSPYAEWRRLTRFFEGARLALARERELWASMGISDATKVRINERYKLTVRQHIDAMDDVEMLHGFVLVQSYGLAESAAAARLKRDPRSLGKIEDWGAQLLNTNDRDWTEVDGGLGGAVEVAVSRNAIAHGSRTIDGAGRARLLAAGARAKPIGSPVTLTYDDLREYRDRLRSLLNEGGIVR